MAYEVIEQMSDDEAWAFLEAHEFGRLAFVLVGDPDIVPLNYVARDGRVIFRTSEGGKLFAVVATGRVALEVDQISGHRAQSVVVHGTARVLEGHEAEAAEKLPLRPWLPTLKYNVVEITPIDITGRRFHLGPEPARY